MVAQLIIWAYEQGYEMTFGDAYRDPRAFGEMKYQGPYGRNSSCHKIRLAVDLNLFKDGKYLTETLDHLPLGEYWEGMGGTWGGRFDDGNHYSLEHLGVK
jgi:hypothetical protein